MNTWRGQALIDPSSLPTVPVKFTEEELWLLHGAVPDSYHPMASVFAVENFREQIEAGVVFCSHTGEPSAYLNLTDSDCVLLQKCFAPAMTSQTGIPHGRNLLLKAMTARQKLNGALVPFIDEPGRTHYHSRMKGIHASADAG